MFYCLCEALCDISALERCHINRVMYSFIYTNQFVKTSSASKLVIFLYLKVQRGCSRGGRVRISNNIAGTETVSEVLTPIVWVILLPLIVIFS